MNLLKKYFLMQKTRLVVMFLLKILASSVGLFIPWAFAHIVEYIIPLNSQAEIIKWSIYMILFAILNLVSNLLAFHINANFTVKLSKDIRTAVFEKSCHLDCDKVDKFGISSITSRLTSDIMSVQTFSGKLMTKGVATITTFIGSIATASIMDIKLAIVMFICVPFIMLTVYFTMTIALKRFALTRKATDDLVKSIRENVMGIRVIKALSKFEYEETRFETINESLKKSYLKAGIVDAIGSPTMKLIINIGMVATLLVGAYFINSGLSDLTSLIAFMSYFTMVLTSLVGIGQMFTMYSKAGAAANRIEEIINTENHEFSSTSKKYTSSANIEFKNVSFSYDDSGEVLKNISFSVKKGETLGIIGVTGSGKSTLTSLLLRLYEPTSGEIFINGQPINNYESQELYEMFGVVFQSDIIFSDSVSENINFGRNISENDIKSAAKSSQAEHFISNLKEKYNSLINIRGQNISGGEKQRLLISRAIASKPEILLLDDSTSALDYKTDALLRKSLATELKNSTKILVSSRVASIMNAEQILVINDGQIVSKGVHSELVKSCEIYKEISKLQLGDSKLYA